MAGLDPAIPIEVRQRCLDHRDEPGDDKVY
jgi:hypothetical protein